MRDPQPIRGDVVSLGPECAVLASIGTVYLYRLRSADVRAYRQQPGTRLAIDKFRNLLARVGSTFISDKGVLDAGALTSDQVESLSDDEVERLAEAYLESTGIRRCQHEGAPASPALVRNPGEPATKFLDRLINWYAASLTLDTSGTYPPFNPKAAPRIAKSDPPATRELWIVLGGLVVVAALAIGAIVQNYLVASAVQRQQEALLAQVRDTNALLAAHAAREAEANADLRRRIEALETTLRAQAQAAAKARETKPKAGATRASMPKAKSSAGPANGARPRAREPAARR